MSQAKASVTAIGRPMSCNSYCVSGGQSEPRGQFNKTQYCTILDLSSYSSSPENYCKFAVKIYIIMHVQTQHFIVVFSPCRLGLG